MKTPIFNALTFPLTGSSLIEASAGTGKTYSACNVYLRILIGHQECGLPLKAAPPIQEILVLTFSRAATTELQTRISKRISEAIMVFSEGHPSKDVFLEQLKTSIPKKDHTRVVQRLRYASVQIDLASIFTIHSFCQKLMAENHFTLNQNKLRRLELNVNEHIKRITRDAWRMLHNRDKTAYQLATISQQWPTFETFNAYYSTLITNHEHTELHKPLITIDTSFEDLFDDHYISLINNVKTLWCRQQSELNSFFNSNDIKYKNRYKKPVKEMNSFCQQNNAFFFSKYLSTKIEKLTYSHISLQLKKENCILDHISDVLIAIEELLVYITDQHQDSIKLRQWLLLQLKNKWRDYKSIHFIVTPSDLLYELNNALSTPSFKQDIRDKYPFAIIDEFQDTDALQYNIFKRIYIEDQHSSLVLIGDPKQAIYRFRAADLHTYLNAKKNISSERIFSMETNWRSSKTIIACFNYLFSRHHSIFMNDNIQYKEVISAPNPSTTDHDGITYNSKIEQLTFWLAQSKESDTVINKVDAQSLLFSYCASKIHELLNDANTRVNQRTIRSEDICILVRSNDDAIKIQTALNKINISSTFLNKKDSIYNSQCALHLCYFFNALLQPNSTTSLSTILATSFYQIKYDTLSQSDLDSWQHHFNQLHEFTHTHDLLSFMNHWRYSDDIDLHLYSLTDGTRWLTDLNHLCYLLTEQMLRHDTLSDLINAFQETVYKARNNELLMSDEQQLHLNSDKELITITTMHSSKGLEYPIVFIPYGCGFRKDTSNIIPVCENGLTKQVISLYDDDATQTKQNSEQLSEDMRLLYVALTRAKYACYVGFNEKGLYQSALGHLLGISQEKDNTPSNIIQNLEKISSNSPISYELINDYKSVNSQKKRTHDSLKKSLSFSEFKHTIPSPIWGITSYSQLTQSSKKYTPTSEYLITHPDKVSLIYEDSPIQIDNLAPTTHTFPKGAEFGIFFHSILEDIEFHSNDDIAIQNIVSNRLKSHGFSHLSSDWQQYLCHWIDDILSVPLASAFGSMTLRNITHLNKEMHFYLDIPYNISSTHINTILSKFEYSSHIKNTSVQGLLTGYIDLLFEHNNKYYIVDYKSNHLGEDNEAYTQPNLNQAVSQHGYDIQYIFYTLAIHRLLHQRLQNYCYDTHLGGCFCLFLRGMSSNDSANGVFYDLPPRELIETLDLYFASGSID
jgi:exodeoxyribonuclease V beta subunit